MYSRSTAVLLFVRSDVGCHEHPTRSERATAFHLITMDTKG
jgi:hypothetical protein